MRKYYNTGWLLGGMAIVLLDKANSYDNTGLVVLAMMTVFLIYISGAKLSELIDDPRSE